MFGITNVQENALLYVSVSVIGFWVTKNLWSSLFIGKLVMEFKENTFEDKCVKVYDSTTVVLAKYI